MDFGSVRDATYGSLSPMERQAFKVWVKAQTGLWINEFLVKNSDTLGATLDQAAADAARRDRKTAGKRALVRKYGHEAAQEIISRKAGRTIHLQ